VVRVRTRTGSLVDARYPCAVAAGNVETSQRLVDCLLGALARALPGRIPAASAGTMANLTFGGTAADGRAFTYYETNPGGAGASPRVRGASALQTHMTNTRNTPIETLETSVPVRVLGLAVRRGSGGSGARRGGDGLAKRLLFLEPARVTWVAERVRRARGVWGGGGGEAPARARVRVPRERGRARELGAAASLEVPAGSVLELLTPGGGGHGRAR
jgi:N-methylhydantoinase B